MKRDRRILINPWTLGPLAGQCKLKGITLSWLVNINSKFEAKIKEFACQTHRSREEWWFQGQEGGGSEEC